MIVIFFQTAILGGMWNWKHFADPAEVEALDGVFFVISIVLLILFHVYFYYRYTVIQVEEEATLYMGVDEINKYYLDKGEKTFQTITLHKGDGQADSSDLTHRFFRSAEERLSHDAESLCRMPTVTLT